MKWSLPSARPGGKARKRLRACGRAALFAGLLAVAVFIFLRVHGVPKPILQEVIRRANAAGLPISVDKIKLTLHGWRATQVQYYSPHPDDLAPILTADKIYFTRRHRLAEQESKGWCFQVKAEGIVVEPSVAWGIDLPPDSPLRKVDQLAASFGFLPDRITISRGKARWMGVRLYLDGTVLKAPTTVAAATSTARTVAPVKTRAEAGSVWANRANVRQLETLLAVLESAVAARAEIDFTINAGDRASSRMGLRLETDELDYNGVHINHLEVAASYAHPRIELTQALLRMGAESARLAGVYDLESGQVEGTFSNSIGAADAVRLVPATALRQLTDFGFRFDALPQTALRFGPAALPQLCYSLSGSVALASMAYDGVEIRALSGRVESNLENRRVAFKGVTGSVLGQPGLAAAVGSSMKGGALDTGEVFWDGNTMEFGVVAEGSFDPNLLLRPLDFVPIATNIIHLFLFEDQPPSIQLRLGACVKNWKSFYINVQGTAEDLSIRKVPLSSVSATAEYKNKILRLDPVSGFQGMRPTKGSVVIDFHKDTVLFDVASAIPPADWEDLIYADLGVFGRYIQTVGDVQINARGSFDWGRMESTHFTAEVEADAFAVSKLATTDRFKASVEGRGSSVLVTNAQFGIYGGNGSGIFRMDWHPDKKTIPYTLDAELSGADFQRLVSFASGKPTAATGVIKGQIHVAADLSTNFFATATGQGFVKVSDGQLRDLPLFKGFSRLFRKVIPGFSVFSITKLRSDFTIANGAVSSDEVYFEGDILSAKGKGKYDWKEGFDATIEVQVFRDSRLTKVVQVLTSPLMKLLKIKLEGPLEDPSWELDNF